MLEVKVEGDKEVAAYFSSMGSRLRAELKRTITKLSVDLTAYVKQRKLSGQVLHRRTGTLSRSIHFKVDETPDGGVAGTVGTNIVYGAIHEYGGRIKTRLGTGKGPPKKNGKAFATMPERSFLRSSLSDNSAKIGEELNKAVERALKA